MECSSWNPFDPNTKSIYPTPNDLEDLKVMPKMKDPRDIEILHRTKIIHQRRPLFFSLKNRKHYIANEGTNRIPYYSIF